MYVKFDEDTTTIIKKMNTCICRWMDPNRNAQRILFEEALSQYDQWARISEEDRTSIVRRLERSCHTFAVRECTIAFIPRCWDEPKFSNRYSTICYKILSNIDRASAPLNSLFAIRIITGAIDPLEVCDISSRDMCPCASWDVYDELRVQSQQHVDEKFIKAACGKCGAKKVIRVEAQTRSADEISSFHYKCKECSHTWGK